MRLYLDDERPTPAGWISCRWPTDVIARLQAGGVTEISLDHDLGDDVRGTGYDVLVWIERAVYHDGFEPPIMRVHSANPAGRQRMEAAIRQIWAMHDTLKRCIVVA